jgi:hypothetical protein
VIETTPLRESWWKAKADLHSSLMPMVSYLSETNRTLREDTRFFMELTSNWSVSGNGYDAYSTSSRRYLNKTRYNLCQSSVDTGASLILQNRTVPMAMTTDGDFQLQRRAERWTRAIQGQFYDLKVFEIAADIGVDALQVGTGFAIGWVETDEGPGGKRVNPRVCVERILPNEILVDAMDGQYRSPRSIYRIKLVAREQLAALYPKQAVQIRVAGGPCAQDFIDFFIRQDNRADFVRVVEAWHLPSGKGKKDGKHVICTDNCDLRVEPYDSDTFPIVAYRYAERRLGFHGQGLVERVCPAQIRLSELQQAKRDMQRLCSNPYMMVERNSGVDFDDMTNMPGQMVMYQGTMPQLVVFEGTPSDLSNEESQIKQEVWEQEGFAAMVAYGESNKALSSARAVRAADDVASRRHVMPIRLYEQLFLDFANLIATLNDECSAIDPQYKVTGRYRSGRKSWIKQDLWTDLRLPKENVQPTVFPISALPTTPQGMWSSLEEMTQAGMIGKNMAMDLAQMPDIDAFDSLANSNLDLTRWQIDRILDGVPELPIPQQLVQDPAESAALVTQAMLVAYRMQAPDEVLVLFENYLGHIKLLLTTPEAAAQPQPAPAALNPAAAAAAQVAMAQQALPAPGAPPMGIAA